MRLAGRTLVRTDRFGHPRLKMRHMPQNTGGGSIGIKERDQWLACMDQAMRETGVDDGLRTRLNASFPDRRLDAQPGRISAGAFQMSAYYKNNSCLRPSVVRELFCRKFN